MSNSFKNIMSDKYRMTDLIPFLNLGFPIEIARLIRQIRRRIFSQRIGEFKIKNFHSLYNMYKMPLRREGDLFKNIYSIGAAKFVNSLNIINNIEQNRINAEKQFEAELQVRYLEYILKNPGVCRYAARQTLINSMKNKPQLSVNY